MSVTAPTNARELEAFFEEACAGDEPPPVISKAARRPRGRPRIVHNPKSVKVDVPEDFLKAFDAAAGEKGLSRREAIREAMRAWVDQHLATDTSERAA